ncbi:MAG: protein kinase [Acidiferrobacterales bacterium]
MGLFTNYDIEDIIAEGDMATVYKCVQTSPRRPVAVKVLSQQLINRYPEIAKVFEKEFLIIARLNHPNIVPVIDRGMAGGLPYFVMDYVDAIPLDVALKTRSLDLSNKLHMALQICKALSYAHLNGVIHRNLKPANVLVDKEGNIQITDFAIAQLVDIHADKQGLMGTPDYMSPEQKVGSKLTAATDVYSLGVIMYEIFTGQLPGKSLTAPSYHDQIIPAYLDEIITTCLHPDPINRYASADKVKDKMLESLWGAHIQELKKKRVLQGMGDINTRFAMLDVIKETRFGSLYLCDNTINHRRVVVKKVPGTKEGYKENTVLSNLQHPNVVNIFGTSTEDNGFIVIMEYLSRGNLNDRLVHPLAWKKAVNTVKEICQGMAFIHANNLVHGNLRPSNILFSRTGEAKVGDCSLREHYRGETTGANWYVYPNQPISKLGDIYAAGAILFEMICATVPTWRKSELVANKQFDSLPSDLQSSLKRMLAVVPKDRYRNFMEVIKELDGLIIHDEHKDIKKQKQVSSGAFTFLLILLLLSSMSALAFYFPEVPGNLIRTIQSVLGLQ